MGEVAMVVDDALQHDVLINFHGALGQAVDGNVEWLTDPPGN